jgi:outer membrane protein TolC
MISLCGIVVRNSIILVDYIKEKLREGTSLAEAATLAGERRLRPIFLTTMAAAVGVTPMILSGSKLWSPLASVLAVGLVFSMFFTLLVVPVLYVLVFRRREEGPGTAGALAPALLALLLAAPALRAEDPGPRVTLDQAVAEALRNSAGMRIARAKVQEAQAKRRTARADYFPQLSADALWTRRNDGELINVPRGSLGSIPGLGPFPVQDVSLGQGKTNLYLQNITLGQPLTQLYKISQGNQVASAEERIAQAELRKMEADIAFKTRQAYLGLLIAQARRDAARAGLRAAELQDKDAREAVEAGKALKVVQQGSRAQYLQNRHKLLTAETALADLGSELNDLMGRPVGAPLDLAPVEPRKRALPSREALLEEALQGNPELAAAKAAQEKSRSALRAGKADFIPEISVFARQTHQEGVPFLRSNLTSAGLTLSWTLFDWGKKAGVVSQRAALVSQASENLRRLRSRVEIDLGKVLRKVEAAQLLVEVAEEAQGASQEKARLARNQQEVGVISAAKQAEAEAAARASEADLLAARLGLDLAHGELDQLLGTH